MASAHEPAALTLFRLHVDEESHGERLDKFIAAQAADWPEAALSRKRIQGLIIDGRVTVNEKPQTKPSLRLKEGDGVVLTVPEARPIALEAQAIPLEVVYEDAALLVINKPAGMLTHPTGRERTGTLVNALLDHCGGSLSGINGQIRPGIVHRLDRDTSGLLMVAKTDVAHLGLSQQLKAKTARRDYRAIAQGKFEQDAGTVDAPIGRNPKHRDKMAVLPDGRPAVTHWRVLERFDDRFALLELSLETGRTHQIRVHMAHIAHPLLGDPLYGSGIENILKLKLKLNIRGQALQAYRLRFTHPVTAAPMDFSLPQDPEITRLWRWLGQPGNA